MQRPDVETREPNTVGYHLSFPTESHNPRVRTNSKRSGPSSVDNGNNGDDVMDICECGCEYESDDGENAKQEQGPKKATQRQRTITADLDA